MGVIRRENVRLTANFNSGEFKCSCCDRWLDSPKMREFMERLQNARTVAHTPFVITSGYRCFEHNAAVGGAVDSAHTKGLAADIRARSSAERFKVVGALLEAGFTRIGIGKDFVHVDTDDSKPQRIMWLLGRSRVSIDPDKRGDVHD